MTVRKGFVAAGCWTLDRIKLIDYWPAEEELACILGMEMQGGGSGHNFGIDIKKLDPKIPVAAIGLLGLDAEGDFLQARAEQYGIDTGQLHRSSVAATSFTDVLCVLDTGKRTFFHHSGTNNLITPEHFDFSNSTEKWIHLGLLGLHNALDSPWKHEANGWVAVLKHAKACGLKTNIEMVSIEPARNREICLPCLPYLDALIINDHEAGSLSQIETIHEGVANAEACLEAATAILALGSMRVVVVHYPAGAICIQHDGKTLQTKSVKVEQASIVSAVGAGDAFAAGMLYGLHEDWPLVNALELAHAAAAASLRSVTTVDSVEDVSECLALAGITLGEHQVKSKSSVD